MDFAGQLETATSAIKSFFCRPGKFRSFPENDYRSDFNLESEIQNRQREFLGYESLVVSQNVLVFWNNFRNESDRIELLNFKLFGGASLT